jgi:hypothetical protein
MHLCMFNKLSLRNILLHLVNRGEVIVDAIDFSLARLASCVRDRKAKLIVGETLHEHINQRPFSYSAGACKHHRRGKRIFRQHCCQ